MEEKNIPKELYEKKYLDESQQVKNSLVAPDTPGSKILAILGFEKIGDKYTEFEHKNVTDIGGGLSSLAFELSPSVEKIIVVDPMYQYDTNQYIEREKIRAEKRLLFTKELAKQIKQDLLEVYALKKEVGEGIQQREKNRYFPDPKIIINDSFAQDIVGIPPDSQDVVFLNFVLDKLIGEQGNEKEIRTALHNAYTITKSGGKIYGVYKKGGSSKDYIINALSQEDYKRDAWYKENKYMIFIIDKE